MDSHRFQNVSATNLRAAMYRVQRHYRPSKHFTGDAYDRFKMILPSYSWLRASGMIILLAFLVLTFAQAKTTKDRVLYSEGFLKVVSPDKVSVQQCKTAARRVIAAWKFDLSEMRWTYPAEIQGPFDLKLLSDERMKEESPGLRAVARGNTFRTSIGLLDDPNIDGTFAHELGHLQAFRALRNSKKAVPLYFLEGHGLMMNQLYADHIHIDRHKGGGNQVRGIMSLTGEKAQAILTDDTYSKVGTTAEKTRKYNQVECLGLYFVEYLRVRKNIPDAVPRMGRVFELVGRGRTYEQAFAQIYGIPLNRFIAEIIVYFKRTEAHPEERIKGTRLEEYLPS
jgi:hypothetical protein